jgi:hypothetical protein
LTASRKPERLLRQAAPPPIYQRPDFSRSFAQIEPPKDTLAWHEIAKDLIVLRWNSHVFIDDEDYHPKAHTWIGRNKKTNLPAAVLCLRDPPSSAEIDSFIRYVSEVHKDRNIEMIAAIQYGIDNCLKRYDNTEIQFETQDSLLNNLVDFEDYYAEIIRRVTLDTISDSRLTISQIYVSPLCDRTSQHDASWSSEAGDTFENIITEWSSENSNRQIALLGEYGQGKSTVALKFVYDLIPAARAGRSRIPLLIELRGKSPSTLQPLEFLGAWASAYRIEPRSLMRLIVSGHIIIIFEGFDEMAEAGDIESRLNHFRSIWRFFYPNSKIIITGRPNFFLDDHELKAALGIGDSSGALPYCDPIYLRFFDEPQMKQALRNMDLETQNQIISLCETDSKFKEIVSRPALLHIVALLWKSELATMKDIDSAYIIGMFINYLYQRQASKSGDDRPFMYLSLSERKFFQEGIVTYMVANSLKNQILPEQFRDAILQLFENIPIGLFKKAGAQERFAPTRPLSERLKGRPNPLDDIITDVRTYGVLVRDYSRSGALRFPHKSFFEFLFAQYVADQLIGENKEERSAIRSATKVSSERIIQMPESLSFLGERRRSGVVEIGRFKGLGEMMPAQLKETTMDPKKRTLLKVMLVPDDRADTQRSVERLMGTKAEARFDFIQERAEFASTEMLDV